MTDRARHRSAVVIAGLMAMTVSGCGGLPTVVPTPTLFDGLQPIGLPVERDLVPDCTAAVGAWTPLSSFPSTFDPEVPRPDAEAVAEAFADALAADFAGAPVRPTIRLSAVDEQEQGRTLLVLTELGVGDDSVAGTQYAIVAIETADGWRWGEHYARVVCLRGVADGLCV